MVEVRLRRRRRVCSCCGQVCRASHDTVRCRWRHLDLGAQRCYLVAALRRVKCADCGVRVEAVPWARGPRFTRDLSVVAPRVKGTVARAVGLLGACLGCPEPGSRWSAPPDERP
jgi:hypothetical protein